MPQWIRVSGLPGHVGKVVLRPQRVRVFGTQVVFGRPRWRATRSRAAAKLPLAPKSITTACPRFFAASAVGKLMTCRVYGPELDNSVREMSVVVADVVAEPPDGLEITREPFVGEIRGGACHVEVER
jgi:hypothetical protein